MTASVVVGNLMYVVGAIVLAVILSAMVVLRHRKPKSVEANMASFHRGLRALAPDPRTGPATGTAVPRGDAGTSGGTRSVNRRPSQAPGPTEEAETG